MKTMKKIQAIIRESKFQDVVTDIVNAGVLGLTVTRVLTQGSISDEVEMYRGVEIHHDFKSQIKLDILVEEQDVQTIVDAIIKSGVTGEIGDGKIEINTIDNVVRIRTQEEGTLAL
jgi:nitrogen regulatory protein PII